MYCIQYSTQEFYCIQQQSCYYLFLWIFFDFFSKEKRGATVQAAVGKRREGRACGRVCQVFMGSSLAWGDSFFFVLCKQKLNFQYKLTFYINCKCISKEKKSRTLQNFLIVKVVDIFCKIYLQFPCRTYMNYGQQLLDFPP